MTRLILMVCFVGWAGLLHAQEATEWLGKYSKKEWKSRVGKNTLKYRTRPPDVMESGKLYPLVLLLHGAGGRGDDNSGQLVDAGGGAALEKMGISSKFGAYVIAGQVPAEKLWVDVPWTTLDHEMPKISESMKMMLEALDAFIDEATNQVDPRRIYVVGLSMGGYGTWDALQRRPTLFAGAVPICGGGDKRLAEKIANVPIWAWHGDQDNVVKSSRSRDMIAALEKAGGSPRYTEIKDRGHNVWADAFEFPEMWKWLFSQRSSRSLPRSKSKLLPKD